MDVHLLLVFTHIAGTILGVGGATIAEVQIIKALKDGKVDDSEKALMHANYTIIRVGTFLVLLSGIALVWWWYFFGGSDWPLTSAKVWVKDIMILAIVINAWCLSKRYVPLWLGSAISFTSWWGATVLGTWRGIPYSFTEIFIGYLVAIVIMAGVLELIRKIALKR